jgi:hypothetical protein
MRLPLDLDPELLISPRGIEMWVTGTEGLDHNLGRRPYVFVMGFRLPDGEFRIVQHVYVGQHARQWFEYHGIYYVEFTAEMREKFNAYLQRCLDDAVKSTWPREKPPGPELVQ